MVSKNIRFRKMRGGNMESFQLKGGAPSSSNGFFISNSTLLIILLVGFLAFVAFHIYKIYSGGSSITQHIINPAGQQQAPPQVNVVVDGSGGGVQGDDRYSMAPKPLRFWRAPPDPGVWNPTTLPTAATRGLPEMYQTIGLLKYPGGDLKPLYGRRTAGSNDRWNYYTRTDTYNPVPVPLKQGRRDCMEDTGCNEVFDGDKLKSLNGEEVGVTLYKMNGPTYIPSV